ncbi:hypothetical protein KEM56_001046 [Ascosphaera pollenicola]|nr:hypothetical protein KEM56_001046 [Ascosphaera pollenicola]
MSLLLPLTLHTAAVKTARPDEAERIDRVIGRGPNAPERATKFASAGAAASLARAASKRSLASDFDVDAKLVAERNSLGRAGYRGALNAAGDFRQLVGNAKQDLSKTEDPEGLMQKGKTGALLGATNAFRVDHTAETALPSGIKEASNFPVARVHEVARENARKGMLNAYPPVSTAADEKKREAELRAAAVSMARALQRSQKGPGSNFYGVDRAAINNKPQALHDAAVRAAKDRVDKFEDLGAAMREWFIPPEHAKPISHKSRPLPWKKFSPLHAVQQTREGEVNELAPERLIQRNAKDHHLGQLQSIQRTKDRANLFAIAQQNANKTMWILDEEICVKAGKPSGGALADADYRDKRWAQLEARKMTPELVAIGGGKAVHTDEVEDLARERLEPTLSEMDFGSQSGDTTTDQGTHSTTSAASSVKERGMSWLKRFRLKRKAAASNAGDTDNEAAAHGAGSVTGDSTSAPSTADNSSEASGLSQVIRVPEAVTAPLKRRGLNLGKLFGRHRIPGTSQEIGIVDEQQEESTTAAEGTSQPATGTSQPATDDESTAKGRRRLFSRRKSKKEKGQKLTVEDVPQNPTVGNEYLHQAPEAARAVQLNEPDFPDIEDELGVPSALRESRFKEKL